tara:strand:- start:1868 stop:2071 length:204 start_codon:yes stop_codon:yes gene_type:complete
LIKQAAKEHNLSEIKTELIVLSQFKFVRNVMEEGDYKSIRLMHLGKFVASPKRIKQREDKKKKDELL